MKILLINPWITDFKAYDEWMRPFALYRFMEAAPPGHEIHLIDCLDEAVKQKKHGTAEFRSEPVDKPAVFKNIPRRYKRYGISADEFRARLARAGRPDLALITSLMTFWHPGVRAAADLVREAFPGVRTRLGGIYAALMPVHAARIAETGNDIAAFLPGVNGFSPPACALQREVMPMRLVRGCPMSCPYCASPFLGGGKTAVEDMARNLQRLDRYYGTGGRRITFYDDAALFNFENGFGVLAAHVREKGMKLETHFPNGLHAGSVTRAAALALAGLGAKTLRLGYETHETDRKCSARQMEAAIENLCRAGYRARDIGVYLMIGPDRNLKNLDAGARFLHGLGVKIYVNQYSPVPGSPLFAREAQKYPELESEPLLHNDFSYIFTHCGFDWNEVMDFKQRIREMNGRS